MMKRAILSVVTALALMAAASAQDKPKFAGTWKAAGSFNTWTITVEGSKMTVTLTVAGNSDSTVYLLDGTPSTKTMEGPNGPVDNVLTSTWEGDVLVTTITSPAMTRIERRSIEADGTMKVQTTITMMQGKPAPPPPPGAGAGLVLKRVDSAHDKPNFAGTWEMDRARSSPFAAGAPAIITVEGAKMTITRTMAGNSSSWVFMLDGTPSKNVRCEGCAPLILTSRWEGNVLVTPIGPERIEKYSIQEDGTLKMEIILPSRNETGVLVFKRVK